MKESKQNKMENFFEWMYKKTIDGVPGSYSVPKLADKFVTKHSSEEVAVEKFIDSQIKKSIAPTFLTSAGGVMTLPINISVGMATLIYTQMRIITAIAYIRGYNLDDDKVQTMVYMCLTGQDTAKIAKLLNIEFVKESDNEKYSIPKEILNSINKYIIKILIQGFSIKGTFRFGDKIPVLGGIIGASYSIGLTKKVAKVAKSVFTISDDENKRNSIILI